MINAATGYSKHNNAQMAARIACESALQKAKITRADAVIVFASTRYRKSFQSLLAQIHASTGARTIVGASGYGILTDEIEIERQTGIGVLVLASNNIQMESFLATNLQENNFLAGERAALSLRGRLQPQLAVLFPDPFSFISPMFFEGFENSCGYVPMIGGAAAEEGKESKTYQFEGGRATFDSVAGLAFQGNFRFETGLTRSCRPFGEALQITRAQGNSIYEMEGRPAYDMLLESISHIPCNNPDKLLENIFVGMPLRTFQTDFTGNHYLVRNIVNVNPKKGTFTCTSPVEEGEFVTFTFRDANLAREDMRVTLQDLQNRLGETKPAFGFYFNCCARGQALYEKSGEDIAMIREHFPNVPILGFFSFGELAPIDHVNHLHHHCGILTLLAE